MILNLAYFSTKYILLPILDLRETLFYYKENRRQIALKLIFGFANILWARFGPDSYIVYDPIINHFACQIGGHVFDITGDITDDPQYKWVMWSKYMYEDPAHTKRIVRDCIWKIPHDLLICGICPKSFEDDHGNLICECDYSPVGLDDPCIFGYTRQEVEA